VKLSKAKASDFFGSPPRGATISDITVRATNPNLRVVRVDGRAVVTLHAADVESLRLAVGRTWTKSLADSVASLVAVAKGRKTAIRILGGRPCSRTELVEKLIARKHLPDVAERIADELEKDRWLDDRAFAELLVRQATRTKPAGQALLLKKLESRGIDRALAEQVIRSALSADRSASGATELARHELAKCRTSSPVRNARRVAAALQRRGFDEETVFHALERIGLRLDDAPPDHARYGDDFA
jgi:regulatory protein